MPRGLRLCVGIAVAVLQDSEQCRACPGQNGANILIRECAKMGQEVHAEVFQQRMQQMSVHQLMSLPLYAANLLF